MGEGAGRLAEGRCAGRPAAGRVGVGGAGRGEAGWWRTTRRGWLLPDCRACGMAGQRSVVRPRPPLAPPRPRRHTAPRPLPHPGHAPHGPGHAAGQRRRARLRHAPAVPGRRGAHPAGGCRAGGPGWWRWPSASRVVGFGRLRLREAERCGVVAAAPGRLAGLQAAHAVPPRPPPQCSREFWGASPAGVREISRACALEDEAAAELARAVPPELQAALEAIAARGGPAPPPPSERGAGGASWRAVGMVRPAIRQTLLPAACEWPFWHALSPPTQACWRCRVWRPQAAGRRARTCCRGAPAGASTATTRRSGAPRGTRAAARGWTAGCCTPTQRRRRATSGP